MHFIRTGSLLFVTKRQKNLKYVWMVGGAGLLKWFWDFKKSRRTTMMYIRTYDVFIELQIHPEQNQLNRDIQHFNPTYFSLIH